MNTIEFAVPYKHDRSRHAAVQVFDHLRSMIISLALKPGTVLPRLELADYFALSLTPIRDALLRLEEEGLVDIFPQHATVVRQIDVMSARQAHFLRLSMELEIVDTLARARPPELVRNLRATIALQLAADAAGDVERFSQADLDFHRQMYQAAHVEALWDLLRSKSGNLDRLRRLHLQVPIVRKAASILHDHAAIVDAIEQNDAALAQLDEIRARYPEFLLDAA